MHDFVDAQDKRTTYNEIKVHIESHNIENSQIKVVRRPSWLTITIIIHVDFQLINLECYGM